jgi:hypothetical protein
MFLAILAHAQVPADTSLIVQQPSLSVTLPNIAVIPFTGDASVTAEQLAFITGKFSGELNETGAFKLLERGKMEYILNEQGFQQSDVCINSQCKVQMGQLLGVDKIITGSLVRFGKKYAFRAEYIDVGTGQVLFGVESMENGELEDVFVPLCKSAALQLLSKVQGTKGPVLTAPPANAAPANKSSHLTWTIPVVIGMGVAGLGSVALGYFENKRMNDQKSKYLAFEDANPHVSQSVIDNTWKQVTAAQTKRNICYAVGGALLAIGLTVQIAF